MESKGRRKPQRDTSNGRDERRNVRARNILSSSRDITFNEVASNQNVPLLKPPLTRTSSPRTDQENVSPNIKGSVALNGVVGFGVTEHNSKMKTRNRMDLSRMPLRVIGNEVIETSASNASSSSSVRRQCLNTDSTRELDFDLNYPPEGNFFLRSSSVI